MTKKHIIIGCSSALVVLVLLVGVAVYLIYRIYAPIFSIYETPEELKQPRIVRGSGLLEKTRFLNAKQLGEINAIGYGEFDQGPGPELVFVGEAGALFANEKGVNTNSITFAPNVQSSNGWYGLNTSNRYGGILVIDIDGDKVCEFLVRNNLGKAELIDHTGASVWISESEESRYSLQDTAAGDLDGDGKAEYVMAYAGSKGLMLLNSSRSELWSKPDVHANSIALTDTNGDGKLDIVHDDFDRIVIRDINGNIVSDKQTRFYVGEISLVRWPDKMCPQFVLHSGNNRIQVIDFFGGFVAEYPAPLSDKLFGVRGVTVNLKAGRAEYFAVVVGSGAVRRSVLFVFDSDHNLVYHEVLGQKCPSISMLRISPEGEEAILLGCYGEILLYRIRKSTSAARH